MKKETVLEVIRENPGIHGAALQYKLMLRSRAAAWFGPDSILTELFGASFGGMYMALDALEREGIVRSEWGIATAARGFRRPRLYWAAECVQDVCKSDC